VRRGRVRALRVRLPLLRREQLTTEFLEEFLRTAWRGGVEFVRLDLEHPEKLPVSPRTLIDDNIGFQRAR
jgi:hypothetical protein